MKNSLRDDYVTVETEAVLKVSEIVEHVQSNGLVPQLIEHVARSNFDINEMRNDPSKWSDEAKYFIDSVFCAIHDIDEDSVEAMVKTEKELSGQREAEADGLGESGHK